MDAQTLEPIREELDEGLALPKRQPRFPDNILWLLEAPDVVEVMSVRRYDPDPPEDEDEVEEIPTGPGYLHGYYIRGTARVPTAARRRALAQSLIQANHEGLGWAMCFDADYAVRVSRGGRSADFLICFWCGNVCVVVPEGQAVKYPLGWSAARLLRRELRRGGVGWLWFWRRWLP